MNKCLFLFLFLFCACLGLRSQTHNFSADKEKIDNWNHLAFYFRFSISDSGIYYSSKALTLSREINYREGELPALLHLALSHQTLGNRARALRFALEGKKKAEEYQDDAWIARYLTVIGVEYYYAGDYEMAIENLRASDQIFDALDMCNQFVSTTWMGFSYAVYNNIDSGLFFCRKALAASETDRCRNAGLTMPLLHLGSIFNLLKTFDSSLYYYKLHLDRETGFIKFRCDAALGIAGVYKQTGQMDSCLYYANLALKTSIDSRLFPQIIETYSFFETLYEKKDPVRALAYSKMSRLYSDSLETIRYKTSFSDVADFDEQQRQAEIENAKRDYRNKLIQFVLIFGMITVLVVVYVLRRSNKQKEKANRSLSKALTDLKSAQAQLIQSEKMASLGELTAGIAHEMQNPLNFVNNFSDVNADLLKELQDELDKGNIGEAKMIIKDITENESKIKNHGMRAEAIVKGMLQHSSTRSGQKEPIDINELCDEFLGLAYHGFQAKDKSLSAGQAGFNVKYETNFDTRIGKINIVPQDMARAVLNLINNAFYAVNEKAKLNIDGYEPKVIVSTKKKENKIEIKVEDNGTGIPESIKAKIFQPFFTTKPPGQGMGLGLSLAYDIVKAHGGEIIVETKERYGTEFTIHLNVNPNT